MANTSAQVRRAGLRVRCVGHGARKPATNPLGYAKARRVGAGNRGAHPRRVPAPNFARVVIAEPSLRLVHTRTVLYSQERRPQTYEVRK